MQSPSLLDDPRQMQETTGHNNAQSLFGVHDIPTVNHIRALLDHPPASPLTPVFDALFDALQDAGIVEDYRAFAPGVGRDALLPAGFNHTSC